MREIPLLANDDVVRRILSGAQTQDRRPLFFRSGRLKGKPIPSDWRAFVDPYGFICGDDHMFQIPGPAVGDAHWIREAWASLGANGRGPFMYRADHPDGERVRVDAPWRPSIHMPRRACRIVKPIVRVWVERIQEITEAGAMAEGVREVAFRPDEGFPICVGYTACDGDDTTLWPTAREAFRREIWEPLYPGSWERNDWVSGVEWAPGNEAKHG